MARLSSKWLNAYSRRELMGRRAGVMERVAERVGESERTLILMKGVDPIMQCGVPLPTKQTSYFRYLTGCSLPSATFLVEARKGKIERGTLFYDRRTKTEELWDGAEMSQDEMREIYCVDTMEPRSSLLSHLEHLCGPSTLLLCENTNEFPEMREWTSKCKIDQLHKHIDPLRLVKSAAEIAAMQKSAHIGSRAIVQAIQSGEKSESAFAARLQLEYARFGASSAYPPVVGAGLNACTVHYLQLSHPFHNGQTVLVDAGADCDGYLSDISRVFPVNGRFSDPQRVLYDLLETVQLTLIEEAKTGDLVLNSLFSSMLHLMGEILKEAGVFTRELTSRELEKIVGEISLHHIGHYLGMDVHDCPSIDRNIRMPPGCVFTIEPGFYIRESELIKREFHGLGMRIEDDVLVEEGGTVSVLTHSCPKAIHEIEALFG